MAVSAPDTTKTRSLFTPTTASNDTSTAARVPQKTLGQSDFLKLITVQLAAQDPMKPMDDTGFIAQMAQFTSLQQTTDMTKQMGLMRSSADLSSASSLIGLKVTVNNKTDGNVTGVVTAVDTTTTDPQLIINGKSYGLSDMKRVEPNIPDPTPSTDSNSPSS
jgi:flagellar basal-body rod modification protein FlgD